MPKHFSRPWDLSDSDITPEGVLCFGERRLNAKQFKALKTGQIRPEARLDLHRLRLDAAEMELLAFIEECFEMGTRCVLVIHGKGGRFNEPPVLKTHTDHWLRQHPEVLAFHSAIPRDGGCGALYVLLRRYGY